MHLFHIPQCSIQNRNVHTSVLNGALWDMGQVHARIYELGQLGDTFRVVNSCHPEFIFQKYKNIFAFLSFVNTEKTQVVEFLPC